MNKIYIAIPFLIFIIAAELVGITIQQVKRPPETSTSVLGSTNNEAVPEPIKKYCENYHFGNDKFMQATEKPKSVAKCGKYYRVEPPATSVNSPFKMVNKKGEVVAICGGVSFDASIESFEQKECEASCELENLCSVD